MVKPAEVLQPWQLWNLLETARCSDGLSGMFLKFVIWAIVSSLRFAHVGPNTRPVTANDLISSTVSKGKRVVNGSRPSFPWGVPAAPMPGISLLPALKFIASEEMANVGLVPGVLTSTPWSG